VCEWCDGPGLPAWGASSDKVFKTKLRLSEILGDELKKFSEKIEKFIKLKNFGN